MASTHVSVVSCTFLRLGCTSDHALFAPTYTRSNKKRNAKLLRCFPHCCPRHIPRSYCGCSLHLLVTFESVDAAIAADQNSQMLVCARFESTTTSAIAGAGDVVTAMIPGTTVAIPASVTALRGLKPSESDWIRAEKAENVYQEQLPENSILYELNNRRSPMWYYSYESGSTKAQRGMKHVLAAYVLMLHPEAPDMHLQKHDGRSDDNGVRLAIVVARQQSPVFTMVSYRRQNDGPRSGQECTTWNTGTHGSTIKLEEDVPTHPSEFRPPLPALTRLVQLNSDERRLDQSSEDHQDNASVRVGWIDNTVTVREAASRLLQDQSKSEMGRSAHESHCPICQEQHSLSHYRNTMELLQSLLVLQLFMGSVPLSAFSFCFSELNSRILNHWLVVMSPVSRKEVKEETTCTLVEDIALAFSLENFVINDVDTTDTGVREQVVLSAGAALIIDAFSSMRFQKVCASAISTAVTTTRGNQENTTRVACEQFCQFFTSTFDALEELLTCPVDTDHFHHSKYTTISALVDDILSLIYSEPKYRSLRAVASALLLQRDDSLAVMAQGLFEIFMTYTHQACNDFPESEHVDDEEKAEHISTFSLTEPWPNEKVSTPEHFGYYHGLSSLNGWCRRWFLDASTLSISPISSKKPSIDSRQDYNPSLLETMILIQAFTAVDLIVEGSRLIVQSPVTTVLRLPTLSGTVLELDGVTHALQSLPSGLPVRLVAAVLGGSWDLSVYKGQIADDGQAMKIILTLLPRLQTNRSLGDRNLTPMLVARQVDVQMILNDIADSRSSLSVFAGVFVAGISPQQFRGRSRHDRSVVEFFIDDESKVEWLPMLEIGATYFVAP